MVEHAADRFLVAPPKSSEFKDTGAEENAWNAGIVALACVMMPDHPRAPVWDEAAKRYLYNALSMASDTQIRTPGDDARAVCDWVTTVNAHPDATVENHNLVHVGYLKTSVGLMLEAGSLYPLAGQAPPRACLHHVPEAFDNLCVCMGWGRRTGLFRGQRLEVGAYAGNRHLDVCHAEPVHARPGRGPARAYGIGVDWAHPGGGRRVLQRAAGYRIRRTGGDASRGVLHEPRHVRGRTEAVERTRIAAAAQWRTHAGVCGSDSAPDANEIRLILVGTETNGPCLAGRGGHGSFGPTMLPIWAWLAERTRQGGMPRLWT